MLLRVPLGDLVGRAAALVLGLRRRLGEPERRLLGGRLRVRARVSTRARLRNR